MLNYREMTNALEDVRKSILEVLIPKVDNVFDELKNHPNEKMPVYDSNAFHLLRTIYIQKTKEIVQQRLNEHFLDQIEKFKQILEINYEELLPKIEIDTMKHLNALLATYNLSCNIDIQAIKLMDKSLH